MLSNPNFRKLDASDQWYLGHEFEDIYLVNLITLKSIELGSMYGDPTCGIIDKNDQWCIAGGEYIVIWYNQKISFITDEILKDTHAIRQIGSLKVEILTDPWSENCAIWELDIKSDTIRKLKDFNYYNDKEYTENVIW
ncbi:hypothetical protein [Apibacter sp. HY039]|uniref:hypothetical protein n=1 Tax=Apibacter sp. HY039 TaxID=2501476 RepID=UPI000FEBDE9F|nr:hypothetical protein [Apibacter sp. HY039]